MTLPASIGNLIYSYIIYFKYFPIIKTLSYKKIIRLSKYNKIFEKYFLTCQPSDNANILIEKVVFGYRNKIEYKKNKKTGNYIR